MTAYGIGATSVAVKNGMVAATVEAASQANGKVVVITSYSIHYTKLYEGIEDMNKNIEKYNDGKPHQPIYKVRIFEMGSKFRNNFV